MIKFNQQGGMHILIFALLLGGIILSLYLVKNPTVFSPQAYNTDDIFSLDGFSSSYGFSKGNRLYNPKYDPNLDGVIDSSDKILLVNQFKSMSSKKRRTTLKGTILLQISEPKIEGPAIESLLFKTANKSGKNLHLILAGKEYKNLINKEIQLNGVLTGNTFFVSDLNQTVIKNTVVQSTAALPNTANNLKIGVIIFRFINENPVTDTVNIINKLMFTDTKSVKNFYFENSLAQATMDGSVLGEYILPYNPSTTGCDFEQWSQDAYNLAAKKVIDLAGYNSIIYVSENYQTSCFYRATAQPAGNTIYINGALDSYNFAHELGHKFGLKHANVYDCVKNSISIDVDDKCRSIEYGDNYDVMGHTVDAALIHFNAVHKMEAGWLTTNQVTNFTSNGQYRIKPLEQSTGPLVIKIPKDKYTDSSGMVFQRFYIISFRQPIGFDTSLPLSITSGASIHIKTEYLDGPSAIAPDFSNFIDVTANNTDPNEFIYKEFLDAVLTDGNSFIDSINKISVKQISHNPNEVVLEINKETSEIDPNLDTDKDEFMDISENFFGTNPIKACPSSSSDNAWPPDVNNDGVVTFYDISFMSPYLRAIKPYSKRYDLNLDGRITTTDLDVIKPYLGKYCPADTDKDGFGDMIEKGIGTDPYKSCPANSTDNTWPPDVNNDGVVNQLDASSFNPYIQKTQPYNKRFDLNLDNVIDTIDITKLQTYFLKACPA